MSVWQAEKNLIGKGNKEYLPIQGLAAFNKATAELLLGPDSSAIKEVSSTSHSPFWHTLAKDEINFTPLSTICIL